MAVYLVIVDEPCHRGVLELFPAFEQSEVFCEYLHEHRLARSCFTYYQKVLLKRVVHAWKYFLTFPAVVEVKEQESNHIGISFVNDEPSTFTAEYCITDVLDECQVLFVLGWC